MQDKNKISTSYQAAIRFEGEDLLADFPEVLGEWKTESDQDEWLKGAQESLMEWMNEQGEQLPIRPKRLLLKRGERLFDLPLP